MQTYQQPQDLQLFGRIVKTFPDGIAAAFATLMKSIPDSEQRSWYGLSKMDDQGNVLYWAATTENFSGEAAVYSAEHFILPKGSYLSVTVYQWRGKTASIKDVFHEMMSDKRADLTKLCVEWYHHDEEMMCLLQIDPVKELFEKIDQAADTLLAGVEALDEKKLNSIPFKDSWTAAQLAIHVTKSNNAIAHALEMNGSMPAREPAERATEFEKMFMDFDHKMKSPEFIDPPAGNYEREKLIGSLQQSNQRLKEKRDKINLNEVIEFAAFGQVTRLELFYFVLYHTLRHHYQLKKIISCIKSAAYKDQ